MKKVFTVASYIPLLGTISLSPIFYSLFHTGGVEVPDYGVFPTEGVEPVSAAVNASLNATIWIAATAVIGLILVLLIRRYSGFLKAFLIVTAVYITFSVSYFYLDLLSTIPEFSYASEYSLTLSLILAACSIVLLLVDKLLIAYSAILLAMMVGLGTIFNASFDEVTRVAILIGYSIFDIYSVYKGILRTAFESRDEALKVFSPLLVRIGPVAIGVGDIIFYSLLLSYALETGIAVFYLSSILLTLGHTLNLWMLKRQKMIPALPIPVSLTLTAIIAVKLF
jgi:presenilin-like A22 family membrane protease